ncbi:MAG: hypothetical protein WB245_05445 [Acidimicrobiia bacterium]
MDMGSEIRVIQVEETEQPALEKPDWSFLRGEDDSDVLSSFMEEPTPVD